MYFVVIRKTKSLVNSTKYLVNLTNLFHRVNKILWLVKLGLFFNYFSDLSKIFGQINKILFKFNNTACWKRRLFFGVEFYAVAILRNQGNFKKIQFLLFNLRKNFLIISYKLLNISILASEYSETWNRNKFYIPGTFRKKI